MSNNNFKRETERREKPECLGKWSKCFKCGTCWFHLICKDFKVIVADEPSKKTSQVKKAVNKK